MRDRGGDVDTALGLSDVHCAGQGTGMFNGPTTWGLCRVDARTQYENQQCRATASGSQTALMTLAAALLTGRHDCGLWCI